MGFSTRSNPDRNAFLFFLAIVWVGVLSGFGTDSFNHVRRFGLDYPLIVHFHAVAFVGWLVLFTAQLMLIRMGRVDIHRRLGLAGAALAAVMVVLGPATALVVSARAFAATGKAPVFMAVQFSGICTFAVLVGAGLLLRRDPAAHKRLMLLGTITISSAGFARLLNPLVMAPLGLGHGFWAAVATSYLCPDLLILGLGLYDLATRHKLYSVYIAGALFSVVLQLNAYRLMYDPAWKITALHLIGH